VRERGAQFVNFAMRGRKEEEAEAEGAQKRFIVYLKSARANKQSEFT
jgi:hypothetical protein